MNTNQGQARVERLDYQPYDGPLEPLAGRFLVVAGHQLRLSRKDKWFRRLLWFSFFPLGIFAVMVIVQSKVEQIGNHGFNLWSPFWGAQIFSAILITYLCGRSTIGEDLRTGAASVYFARPVTLNGYLGGKWLSVFVPVLFVTLGPALLLISFRFAIEPGAGLLSFLRWLAGFLAASILLSAVMGAVMLAVSSLTRRARTAGFLWIGFIIGMSALANGLAKSFDDPIYTVISFTRASARLLAYLVEGKGSADMAAMDALSHIVWLVIGLGIVRFRIAAGKTRV
ncbi:MAG: hypothetical protein GXP49_12910 [Deltaproteobacteria bacterium]|nr:hypothetical protein [Deltaproteobacteria bacterium]